MSRRLLIFLALIPPALAAAWVAADWWLCLPIDKPAEYIGRRQCARCHEKECDLWKNSDHDKAMEPATADTVLGDFDNVDFIHIAFEDVPKLSNGDFDTLLQHVETSLWATALYNAGGDLQKQILGRMGNEAAAALKQATIRNALLLVRDIQRGIRSQAPGGKPFAKLADRKSVV